MLLAGCAPTRPLVPDGGSDAAADRAMNDGSAMDVAMGDGGSMMDASANVRCPVAFAYRVPAGANVTRVEVTGEWNGWANPGVALTQDGSGVFRGDVAIPPGFHGYKLLINGEWQLDPDAARRKYVGGVENSGVRVVDCRWPSFSLVTHSVDRAAMGQGRFRATVQWTTGVEGVPLDPSSIRVTLRRDGMSTPVAGPMVDAAMRRVSIDVSALADGKYTVLVDGRDTSGREAATLRLPFWVEARPFTWQGATIYMAMVDRFANGDRASDATATAGVDPRADYHGGDFQGLRARIADGTLDRLGVRAIWLAPVNENPSGAFLASDGVHRVMGYHGYWPIRAREVEPRLGGAAALRELIAEAHRHGIRVLQDFVVNHVHREHEYFRAHPEWFRTGCVCGTNNCDWTGHRLDCLFTDYLPDVNWTVPEVSEQFAADAAFWVDSFDFDGLRVDAVKHVEDIAVFNLRARLHEDFEATGVRVFLTGETAMGWNDCGVDCNRSEYDTINRYMGPRSLDGQADFVLYHGVPYRVFSSDSRGMLHADYWTRQSQIQYTNGSVMTPYVGSHDTARFVTLASYRGQAPGLDPGIPGNQWDNVAQAPRASDAYARHRLAMAWVLTIPGAPLMYYGDEYGEWGGADPNNRRMWRDPMGLNADESATLNFVRAVGSARAELVALQRGDYTTLAATEETLVFSRRVGSDVAIVALSKANDARALNISVGGAMLTNGTMLRDRLSSTTVTVSGGSISFTLQPWSAAVFAP
jgi:glycosidase